ncbi:MAG: FAD-binding oxidoreductase [Polymorphobacter sp.]
MTAPDLHRLRAAFAGRLLTDPVDTAPFLTDWRGRYTGRALAVAQPDSTADVAAIVRWCADAAVAVVPQGGNSGLSGGATPDASGNAVVLSLARLNRIRAVDPQGNTMTVEAGCILAQVQAAAAAIDRLFPLSLAAEATCMIGGNLSTNAGGTAVLRYGNARALCLGLEVVTAEGEIWDGLRTLRKDNTGYALRDLYIGAEGTLGVITAAVLKLFPRPRGHAVGWVAVADAAAALEFLVLAQAELGDTLTAFELVSDVALGLVLGHFAGSRAPLAGASHWHVLIEAASLESAAAAQTGLEAVLAKALAAALVSDATLAASEAQAAALWALRENISEAQARAGKNLKHDIAVPISALPAFIAAATFELNAAFPEIRLVVFGHMGDGNLHFNVSPPAGADEAAFLDHQSAINRIVHDLVARFDGSISAEHGLGVLRRDEAARYKSPVELALMRRVKAALDPSGRMNPGKVLS